MTSFPRFMIAATHSGAGKTSWTLGTLAAFVRRGLAVQPYKAGPDYIDTSLHTLVAGRPSRNLDTRLVSSSRLRTLYRVAATGADLSLVEGVMGYYDGYGPLDDAGSGASLARLLDIPVFLIIDISGTSSSAAAVALGFLKYRRNSRIAGFLLNRAGNEKHYLMARESIEAATGMRVFGWLPADASMALPERHLGLVSGTENIDFGRVVSRLADAIEMRVDLDAMLDIARSAPEPKRGSRESFLLAAPIPSIPSIRKGGRLEKGMVRPVRIAVARDEAFSFYYEDNLDILERMGAELRFFSPLRDSSLPENCGGLYLGGGYPELYASALESNETMRRAVKNFADSGAAVFAECGGYMYLMDALVDANGRAHRMCGVFRGRAVMGRQHAALGYYDAVIGGDCALGQAGDRISGHCFHWSRIESESASEDSSEDVYSDASSEGPIQDQAPALFLSKQGGAPFADGLVRGGVFASYLHLHFAGNPEAARYFVAASTGILP